MNRPVRFLATGVSRARPGLWGAGILLATVTAARADDLAVPTTDRPALSHAAPVSPAAAAAKAILIRDRFADLNDARPVVREEARRWLLALGRDDLPLLKNVVKQARPVHRSQVAALREIVTHVYLRGDIYTAEPTNRGFLGVMFFGNEFEVTEPEAGGVEIRRRMPGFCAYQYLEDGDVIRSVVANPIHIVHMPGDVIEAVRGYGAGDTVVLEVLRDGRLLRVPIILDARPQSIGTDATTADFLGRRQSEAEAFWDENFDPLVNDTVG